MEDCTQILLNTLRQPVCSTRPVSSKRHLVVFLPLDVLVRFYSNSLVPLHILSSVHPHMWTRLNVSVISYENSDN